MGEQLVTDCSSDKSEGGGNSRQPSFCYGQKFEELCGYYMSIGMTYEEYWNGDCCKTRYYREKDKLQKQRMNQELWLQGAYFYEALLCASPAFNPLSSKKKPFPYRDTPIPLTKEEEQQIEARERQKQLEEGREAMRMMMAEINKRFKDGKEEVKNGD